MSSSADACGAADAAAEMPKDLGHGQFGLFFMRRRTIGSADNDRGGVESLINKTGKLIGPLMARDRPHPGYLAWHRENCFKA